jgi:hypothetical protein
MKLISSLVEIGAMAWLRGCKNLGEGRGVHPDDGDLTYLLFAFKKGKLCYANVLWQNLKCLNKA